MPPLLYILQYKLFFYIAKHIGFIYFIFILSHVSFHNNFWCGLFFRTDNIFQNFRTFFVELKIYYANIIAYKLFFCVFGFEFSVNFFILGGAVFLSFSFKLPI